MPCRLSTFKIHKCSCKSFNNWGEGVSPAIWYGAGGKEQPLKRIPVRTGGVVEAGRRGPASERRSLKSSPAEVCLDWSGKYKSTSPGSLKSSLKRMSIRRVAPFSRVEVQSQLISMLFLSRITEQVRKKLPTCFTDVEAGKLQIKAPAGVVLREGHLPVACFCVFWRSWMLCLHMVKRS